VAGLRTDPIGAYRAGNALRPEGALRDVGRNDDREDRASTFGTTLRSAWREVDSLQRAADEASRRVASGDDVELHDVMLTAEKANLALQLTIEVRNKVIEAYQEIMRMPV